MRTPTKTLLFEVSESWQLRVNNALCFPFLTLCDSNHNDFDICNRMHRSSFCHSRYDIRWTVLSITVRQGKWQCLYLHIGRYGIDNLKLFILLLYVITCVVYKGVDIHVLDKSKHERFVGVDMIQCFWSHDVMFFFSILKFTCNFHFRNCFNVDFQFIEDKTKAIVLS